MVVVVVRICPGLQYWAPWELYSGKVEISLITTSFGKEGVSVLLSNAVLTEAENKALGVTKQEQQATSCSSAENVYTFTQRFPSILFWPTPSVMAVAEAPVLVISITASAPVTRLEA